MKDREVANWYAARPATVLDAQHSY